MISHLRDQSVKLRPGQILKHAGVPSPYLDVVVTADYAAIFNSLDECVPRAVVSDGQTEGVFRLFDF